MNYNFSTLYVEVRYDEINVIIYYQIYIPYYIYIYMPYIALHISGVILVMV